MDFAERAARNEEIFRAVNERIEEASSHGVQGPLPFHCECARESCFARVDLLPARYRAVVAQRYLFVIVPGHDQPQVERVVEEHANHWVVEKIGEARRALDRQHPQQGHQN